MSKKKSALDSIAEAKVDATATKKKNLKPLGRGMLPAHVQDNTSVNDAYVSGGNVKTGGQQSVWPKTGYPTTSVTDFPEYAKSLKK